MTKTPLEAAQEFYASVHVGDFDRLFNAMSDDCCIEFYGPALIPFSGIFKGKEKCKIFFGHVANDVEIEEFSQAEFIAERNMVAVTGRLQMVLKATGRRYSADYAHIITTKDGLVTRFRDFQDTAQAMWASIDMAAPTR